MERARDEQGRFVFGYICPNCTEHIDHDAMRPDDMCVHCYVNEDCPAQCNEEHDDPEPNRRGQWRCPTTRELFRFDSEDGWEHDRYADGSTRIDGRWMCDPYEYDYTRCDDCSEWLHCDHAYYDEYGDGSWCRSCYRERESENEDGYRDSNTQACEMCRCHGPVTHHHHITEKVACATCIGIGVAGYEPIDSLLEAA